MLKNIFKNKEFLLFKSLIFKYIENLKMASPGCICFLCCFNSQTALCIEITLLVVSILGIIFGIWGMAGIPWSLVSDSAEGFFIFSFVLFIIQLIVVIIFIVLRQNGHINNKFNKCARIVSIIMAIISGLFFIIMIILTIKVLHDLNKWGDTYISVVSGKSEKVVTNGDWANAIISLFCSIILWALSLLLWISDCIRIMSRNSGSLVVSSSGIPNQTQVTVVDTSQQGVQRNLFGYDNQGNPVYTNTYPPTNTNINPQQNNNMVIMAKNDNANINNQNVNPSFAQSYSNFNHGINGGENVSPDENKNDNNINP